MDKIRQIKLISEHDVHKHLPMDTCVELMRDLFGLIAAGKVVQPLRTFVSLPEGSAFANMPCSITTPSRGTYAGTKMLTILPQQKAPIPTIQGLIVLFGHTQEGQPLAVIEASSVTGLRTAAASGLATDLLARSDASICAIIGSGLQAETHALAILSVRKLTKIQIYGRSASKVDALVQRLQQRLAAKYPHLEIIAKSTIEDAVKDADVICTVTGSSTPILLDSMVKPGTHINAVGSHGKEKREIDGLLMKRAKVWADVKASTLAEGGDFLIPIREGLYTEDHLQGDLSEIVSNKKSGRQNNSDITVFNSLGIAVEDLQCAIHLYHAVTASESESATSSVRLMSRL